MLYNDSDAKVRYEDTINFDDRYLTVGTLRDIRDTLQQYGSAEITNDFTKIRFVIDAPDLWELRDLLATIETEIVSLGSVHFSADKAKVTYMNVQQL